MAETTTDLEEEAPKGSSKMGMIIGVVLALVGGGGAFVFTSGMLGGGEKEAETVKPAAKVKDVAFIELEPMTVSIGDPAQKRFLRFRANLEVGTSNKSDVEKLKPRVVDVLNTYLRSVTLKDVEDPSSLLKLRAQMRRRIDLVVGEGYVHDLLVMEFVVN